MAEYRIDELAQASGSTVRNIRAYQDRGLLPPPRLEGRVGLYDDSHLARLRLIGKLLGRGYTFAIIKDLISAWETGKDVGEVLGLEQVLTAPWSDEIPGTATREQLREAFSPGSTDEEVARDLERTIELGLIEPADDGEHFRVPSPRLLHVGAELVAAGIPLEAVLSIAGEIRDDCDVIAGRFVGLVQEHVFQRLDATPGGDDLSEMAAMVRRMRPLVKMVVEPFIARAMEARVQAALGDQLEQIRDHLAAESASAAASER